MTVPRAPRERPSPNCGPRRGGPVDILLLHYTGMPSAAAALARLCDPAAEVSAHYLIEEDGTLWRLVDEGLRAWHAGTASWAGDDDINSRSIGIELANPGHAFGHRPFAPAQMAALVALSRAILARHPIPAHRVLGHSDVAPERKTDPGELFDWQALAAAGIGLWPHIDGATDAARPVPDAAATLRHLARYGYAITPDSAPAQRAAVVRAFQRHFRPRRIDGRLDAQTRRIAAALAQVLDG